MPDTATQTLELQIRHRLGIPDDAQHAIIFAESSHWDPDWLYTSEEYYQRFVRRNLDLALAELAREPRRVYSIECIFFLRLYWEREPGKREAIRALVNEGRLRLTSSGVTTADTLLPDAEAILRDLLLGQEWLRAHGLEQEPRLAYFTDSFGCSPALPSLLRAAGFDRTALTRVDGMYFQGCDYEPRSHFPRAGSTAELLLEGERTLDFAWRGPDGAEVLCHWNAFTYSQGDLLAHRGINRVYVFPVAVADRSERNVARHVRRFAAQLLPYSRTPYLFCPIGVDFVAPIPGLVSLLDRYNRRQYPESGLWAVNAGLDDYLALMEGYREQLPVLALDPNPYWTGFYTSRPSLKERCYALVDQLLRAERLSLLPENAATAKDVAHELEDAWWTAATANHHDFITGTSRDRVVEVEQQPWLDRALGTANTAVNRLAAAAVSQRPLASAQNPHRPSPSGRVEWHRQDGTVRVQTSHYALEIAEEMGGGVVRAWCPTTQQPLLAAVSNDLVSYHDSGGLWRMGHEFRGGAFRELSRASEQRTRLEIEEGEGGLQVVCQVELDGLPIRRQYCFEADSPCIRFQVEGRAGPGRTITVRFYTGLSPRSLAMDQPGGVIVRPSQKVYDPTFWPLQHFVHVQDGTDGWGLAAWVRRPAAVTCRPDGRLELVALRNATRERAYGLVPIMATPAAGHERSPYAFQYALWFTPAGDWRANDVARVARRLRAMPWGSADPVEPDERASSLVIPDRDDVFVTAVKPASRGEGWIVRLQTYTLPGPSVSLMLPGREVGSAFLCDARERDLESLELRGGTAHLTMPGAIATVRLMV
jgi:hypothetical protein